MHATTDVDRASVCTTIISSELVHPYSHVMSVCLALFFFLLVAIVGYEMKQTFIF